MAVRFELVIFLGVTIESLTNHNLKEAYSLRGSSLPHEGRGVGSGGSLVIGVQLGLSTSEEQEAESTGSEPS